MLPCQDECGSCGVQQRCVLAETTGQPCSGSEALQILCEVKKQYENLLAEIECDTDATDSQRSELKLKIMTDWVKDLGEQNTMLVQIVRDLEKAAVSRVKLLENKLQETSHLMPQNIMNQDKSEEDLKLLSNKVCQLEADQTQMQKKIRCLRSDISSLLKFIKRGRIDNDWNLDGIQFYEIQPSDIPAPADCPCGQDLSMHEALKKTLNQSKSFISGLQCKNKELEKKLQDSMETVRYKDELLVKMCADLKKAPMTSRKVRISTETCQIIENERIQDVLHGNEVEECTNSLILENTEIKPSEKCNQATNLTNENILQSMPSENENELVTFIKSLLISMKKEIGTSLMLKNQLKLVFESLKKNENTYEKKDIMNEMLVYEKLKSIKAILDEYKKDVIEPAQDGNSVKEFISTIENKISHIQKALQNRCELCAKEDLMSDIKSIIPNVTLSIQTLSDMCERKNKTILSIENMISRNSIVSKNTITEKEQNAIFSAFKKQFQMMEEFRICTVEVQAATEDLREEISAIISNLNSRHCKYVELSKLVNQVQDYLTTTRESISDVINRLELQNEERARHNERIKNNKTRLKDVKNKFNQSHLELTKCLDNVNSNIQQPNLFAYTEVHMCNDLVNSVVEEIEQIVYNLQTFQTQGCCGLSTMTELRKYLILMEHNVKELKKKSDQVLLEDEAAQKSFIEKSKQLEKYECEVDNCHTKMHDVLESILLIRNQINEFRCIKEIEESLQRTNETIKMKDELRKLNKECEKLKLKIAQDSRTDNKDEKISMWENRVIDLQNQIKTLRNEIKSKQEANNFLNQSIESLEIELAAAHRKAEENRSYSSAECLELRKRIFELENALRLYKDTENLKCLASNETDLRKSQFLDFVSKGTQNEIILRQGIHEDIPQLFKALQDTIEVITNGLQDLNVEFKKMVFEELSSTSDRNDWIQVAIKVLARNIESMKHCSFEVEKIKTTLCSKDKLMENMDEIIRIQKDSITISQSEVENLHKKLQEKIDAQEKAICECEKEKWQLNKQIEFQVQTIGHLQEAVVDAKRTIDQLNNKSTSDVSEQWTSVSPTVFNYGNVHDV